MIIELHRYSVVTLPRSNDWRCLNYLKCETDLCLVEVNLLPFRVCLTDTSHLFLLARAGVKTWLYLLLGFPNEYAKFMTITVYRTIKIQQRTTNRSLLSIFY